MKVTKWSPLLDNGVESPHVVMEEFPHFCAQCKSIGHLPGECRFFSPVFDSINKNISGEKVNVVEENLAISCPVKNSIPTVTLVSHIEVMVCGEIGVDDALAVENSNGNTEDAAIVEGITFSSFDALPMAYSCGINEGVEEASEPNKLLSQFVFDDFVPLEPGERVVVPPVAELVHFDSGEVGNALNTPACFNASFSDDFDPMAKTVVPLIEVPISVMSSDALFAHLVSKSRDYEVMHGDWLDNGNSSDDGEEIIEKDLDSWDNFELSIIQFAEDGVSKKSAKRDRRKSKKK
ncbi:hypothetical protein IEQ34_019482 [Dendrobium chrysotoxum]|uniref:Uncharacterized protein n=1 Tax=Dendrobium chrysotoxum TaxID=161865 RepID=A0AAV7G8N8_DENCH|nr:hypothetical protein IEQ34_019482 [Dendrobium chrysotoxum]